MKSCTHNAALLEWSRLGSRSELSPDLKAHVPGCPSCSGLVSEVMTARELALLLPTQTLPQVRLEQMKFLLMATARQQRSAPVEPQGRAPKLFRLGVAALVIVSGVAAAATASRWLRAPALPGEQSVPAPPDKSASSLPTTAQQSRSAASQNQTDAPRAEVSGPRTGQEAANLGTSAGPRAEASATSVAEGPTNVQALPTSSVDAEFRAAWALLRDGQPRMAAAKFDELLNRGSLDPARVSDVLYWSAQSHRQSGNAHLASQRSETLLARFPQAAHAPDAALLLGEAAMANGQTARARRYLKLALTSRHPVVRDRAEKALSKLSPARQ